MDGPSSHQGAFSTSPLSTHAHSPLYGYLSSPQRTHLAITTQLSPTSVRTFPDTLTFPKCAIQSSTASTDTEVSSDYGVDLFPPQNRRPHVVSPTPSLLTSMMQSNQCHFSSAATSRSSSTSQPGPLTPASTGCGKPILRRETSAPTSASEDNCLGMKGLGLALTACGTEQQPKRACSLKFAVRSPPSSHQLPLSDSDHSRSVASSYKRSRARIARGSLGENMEDDVSSNGHSSHHHQGLSATLEQDEDEDEDEGYQEDSEGGFTSEEEDDYFIAPSRGRGIRSFHHWAQQTSFAPYSPGPRRRVTHSADQAVVYTSTNEDCPPPPVTRGPGRKVSIADMRMKFDHCSRHLSPPPRCLDLLPEQNGKIAPAPPPASSPSARDLCRRRESSANTSAGPSRRMTEEHRQQPFRPRANRSAQSDDSAFQAGAQCHSILKRGASNDHQPVSPILALGDRRSSVPVQCRLETGCANGAVSPVSSEAERETASQGLQRCLAKC